MYGGGERRVPVDVAMQVVRARVDTERPVRRSVDVEINDHGPVNYHCAECGALLVRDAGSRLPDVIVICPVCLSLNEETGTSIH